MPPISFHLVYVEILANSNSFLFKPLNNFFTTFEKKFTIRLDVRMGPYPLVERLAPPLLVVVMLVLPLPLALLLSNIN
jgi:hypothetical protein